MTTHLKNLLLICVMVVMPVQGFAAAAMYGCPSSHQELDASEATGEKMAMSDEAMASCHYSEPAQPAPPGQHDCQHCTACYLASPLMVTSLVIAPVTPVPFCIFPHADTSLIGFIPDSPERPPRTSLA